jgi:CRISPR-associated protein Cas2
MSDEHVYVVTYDIADDRRWRAVFRLMHGYGEWLQLSVFQCRLTRIRYVELMKDLEAAINRAEDAVMIIDIGPAESVSPRIHCMGKRGFQPIERKAIVV